MASPAENLRSRLAQYAYAGAGASPSPRRSPRTTAPPTATTSGYVSDDEDSGPSTPSKPAAISPRTPKRRPDGSLDKFGWKKARGYASPEKYAHLQPIGDCLAPELKLIFCGINPGTRSSKRGHHFAHPTNKFWRALHLSGLTPRLLSPEEDSTLPSAYRYGLTNLVDRPTAEQNELSPAEMRAAVLPLVRKFRAYRPRVVCFVGKKIWDIFESVAGAEGRRREKIEKAEEIKREKEREAVRRDVAKQEARAATVVPFALVNGDVVKVETKPGTEEGEEKLTEDEEEKGQQEEAGKVKEELDEPLVSIEDEQQTPTTRRYVRAVPHSSFAFDAPQRLRLVLSRHEPATGKGESDTVVEDPPSPSPAPKTSSPPAHPSSPLSDPPSPSHSPAAASGLPQPSPGVGVPTYTHTYFWVVPNTSGLERTPLGHQAELFGRLRAFVESFEVGEPEGDFVDFTLEDVEVAAAALKSPKASPRPPKTPPSKQR